MMNPDKAGLVGRILKDFVLPRILDLAYALLLAVVSPVLLYRAVTQGKYRAGFREKLLGNLPELSAEPDRKRYWFHAVSVGEVLLLQTILAEVRRREPDAEIVVTTTTSTGRSVARQKIPDVPVCFFPLDFSWAVRRAIARIRPTKIVLVELELWPNFLMNAARVGVPVMLVNGRLSEKSFRGYSRIRRLIQPLLQNLDHLGVQTERYAGRFIDLGACADDVTVTGSVKFDRIESNRRNAGTSELREKFSLMDDEPVFIAGSTQSPEERIALNAWLAVKEHHPQLRLVIVARHKERFEEVARLVESYGLPLLRRSKLNHASTGGRTYSQAIDDRPVLLLDTLGELSACWGLADFAFVGGSLTKRGGQNMIEPAAFGAAVCFGPDTRNFRDTVDALISRDAARVVRNEADLTATLSGWLGCRKEAEDMGRRAQKFVLSQQGATERTVDAMFGDETVQSSRRAA